MDDKKVDSTEVAAHYGLPNVDIYPQNQWGDIAMREGVSIANKWHNVKNAVYKGQREFMEDPRNSVRNDGIAYDSGSYNG